MHLPPAARATLCGVLLLLAPSADPAVAAAAIAPAAAPLVLTPCLLEHPLRLTALPAECGTLDLAENPLEPRGRHIALHVARVPALRRRGRQSDPLFILAGGPGESAATFYVTVASAFARIRRDRDIVLVDQRGTGRSNPLDCPPDEQLSRPSEAQIAADTRRCLAALSARADVREYTTSLAVQDLERVRAALGVARLNLYGASYGTRVAQQYLRRHPRRVRSVILDGVVPVTAALGPRAPLDAERALGAILARCAARQPCRDAFGDPVIDYRAVRAVLGRGAQPVSVPDPTSGARVSFGFDSADLASVLRLMSYTPAYAALLPLVLHAAGAEHDYAPLAAQFLLARRTYGERLAGGMHNSVVCAEDVPFWDSRAVERARRADTYLGTAQLDGLAIVCRVWPHGPGDADLHAPLSSDVPALLLSGGDDPVTPPAFAAQAARGFAHALQLVLPGAGHGQLTAPCMDRVLARFVARASTLGLDTACTRDDRPPPFFTSLNGPPP